MPPKDLTNTFFGPSPTTKQRDEALSRSNSQDHSSSPIPFFSSRSSSSSSSSSRSSTTAEPLAPPAMPIPAQPPQQPSPQPKNGMGRLENHLSVSRLRLTRDECRQRLVRALVPDLCRDVMVTPPTIPITMEVWCQSHATPLSDERYVTYLHKYVKCVPRLFLWLDQWLSCERMLRALTDGALFPSFATVAPSAFRHDSAWVEFAYTGVSVERLIGAISQWIGRFVLCEYTLQPPQGMFVAMLDQFIEQELQALDERQVPLDPQLSMDDLWQRTTQTVQDWKRRSANAKAPPLVTEDTDKLQPAGKVLPLDHRKVWREDVWLQGQAPGLKRVRVWAAPPAYAMSILSVKLENICTQLDKKLVPPPPIPAGPDLRPALEVLHQDHVQLLHTMQAFLAKLHPSSSKSSSSSSSSSSAATPAPKKKPATPQPQPQEKEKPVEQQQMPQMPQMPQIPHPFMYPFLPYMQQAPPPPQQQQQQQQAQMPTNAQDAYTQYFKANVPGLKANK